MIAHDLRTSTVIHPKHMLILEGYVATHLYCLLTKFLFGLKILTVLLQRFFSLFKKSFSFKQLLEKSRFSPPAKPALLFVPDLALSCTPQPLECAGAVADLMPVYGEALLSYSPLPALDTEQVPGSSPGLESREWCLHCHCVIVR